VLYETKWAVFIIDAQGQIPYTLAPKKGLFIDSSFFVVQPGRIRNMTREARAKRQGFLFRYDFSAFDGAEEIRRPDFPFDDKTKKTRYPFRALRYWRAASAILEEVNKLKSNPVIVDMGCAQGILKRFTSTTVKGARWIGLDNGIDDDLNQDLYDEVHTCDLDKGIPLSDGTADILVCLHVFEHLPRPDFTIGELSRVTRPGGLILIETPILPKWMALLRERQFARELKSGKRLPRYHINAFWPKRWKKLAEENGLQVRHMIGSHLLRWSGNPLENYRTWLRLNEFWGILFPSLGRNLFMQFRKAQ